LGRANGSPCGVDDSTAAGNRTRENLADNDAN
jgi:hypothetical protein